MPTGLLVSSANATNPVRMKPVATAISRDAAVGHYDFDAVDARIAHMKAVVKLCDAIDEITVSVIASIRAGREKLIAILAR